jgi:hypothetical protein
MATRLAIFSLFSVVLGFWPPSASGCAADAASDFATVKRALSAKAKSRRPEQRIEAIGKLKQHPVPESAEIIVQAGLHCHDQSVRLAAYRALLELNSNREVCDTLQKILRREARAQKADVAAPLVEVLLVSELPKVRSDLVEFLDEQVATSKAGVQLVSIVATDLANQGDPSAVASLVELARLQFFKANFGYRRGIIQALIRIRLPESLEALIEILANVRGEVRADIVKHLARLSGKNHGADAAAWAQWWKESKDGFEFPDQLADAPVWELGEGGGADYYGIPIYAERMIFVVDISGSMTGPRLAAAKRELIKVIQRLYPEAWFNIVVYSSRASAWQNRMLPATPANKQVAARFVSSLSAGGMTASYDALETAFRFDTEAIFFLSDGAPSAGKIVDPRGIIAFVSTANQLRRVSIYTIGIMPGLPESPLAIFMRTLAEQNFGVYQQVNN